MNEKRSLIPFMRITVRVQIWKLCSRVVQLSLLPWCHMLLRTLEQFFFSKRGKNVNYVFYCLFSFFMYIVSVFYSSYLHMKVPVTLTSLSSLQSYSFYTHKAACIAKAGMIRHNQGLLWVTVCIGFKSLRINLCLTVLLKEMYFPNLFDP